MFKTGVKNFYVLYKNIYWGLDSPEQLHFVIPKQESLDTLAFEEKLGKGKSDIEYDKRRLIVNL